MKAIVTIELDDFEECMPDAGESEKFGDRSILADGIGSSIQEAFDLNHGRYVMVKSVEVEVI